jgi:Ohr subfamily peroxiredoxin
MDAAYVASATSKGGRSGHVRSDSGYVDLDVLPPTELGGPGGATNPEELFAAGYASCFLSALGLLAAKREIDTTEATVTADVGLAFADGFLDLKVELVVRLPGVERAMAEKLVSRAHDVCPYSRATRGNIPVELTIAEPVAA